MKYKLLLTLLIIAAQETSAQNTPKSIFGFGSAISGNGDLPGHMFLLGTHKTFNKFASFELTATGVWTQATYTFARGYEIDEESKGISLDLAYAPQIAVGRFVLFPAVGPSVRFAHERYVKSASIWQTNGVVVDFSADVLDQNQVQFGGMLALNADARLTNKYTFGLRGSIYRYHTGQGLACVGFTIRKVGWWF